MSWFGWLTKGHYEVSALDRLIGAAEVISALGVAYGALWVIVQVQKWNRKRKHS